MENQVGGWKRQDHSELHIHPAFFLCLFPTRFLLLCFYLWHLTKKRNYIRVLLNRTKENYGYGKASLYTDLHSKEDENNTWCII